VRKQLDAYNARDIEAFMACWADDTEISEHPSLLLASGAAEIRERHIARFKEPDLHGHLVHRMVAGKKVIDQEIVTRNLPDGTGRDGSRLSPFTAWSVGKNRKRLVHLRSADPG
jgi:hypothetical protein